jgi:hypothetical protein
MKIWECKIGEVEGIPYGADFPMRRAVEEAYKRITGQAPDFIFSGWGAELTDMERQIVDPPLRPEGDRV